MTPRPEVTIGAAQRNAIYDDVIHDLSGIGDISPPTCACSTTSAGFPNDERLYRLLGQLAAIRAARLADAYPPIHEEAARRGELTAVRPLPTTSS